MRAFHRNSSYIPWIARFLSHMLASSRSEELEDKLRSTETCRLFMAPSTIPNAGIGVFTAVDMQEGGSLGYPDLAIPVTDLDWHNGGSRQGGDYHWLWKDYDWLSSVIGDLSFEAEEVVACIPGIGAMPNCHFRLSNVKESWTRYDTAGLHRSKDPGVGAFTGYHGREGIATKDLKEGSELFVDYGEHWFTLREKELGLVPVAESYVDAELVLEKFHSLGLHGKGEVAMSELWDLIKSFPYKSRALSALPNLYEAANRAIEVGIKETELESSIRSVEWLHKYGKCLDNLRPGNSTIVGAGRGAFATRFIREGNVVAPAPLVHIPYKEQLLIFGELESQFTPEGFTIRNTSDVRGKQLLLNYCFGHSKSTLLLCPYGSGTAFINHNRQVPNVKIVWSDERRAMIHNSTWLTKSVDFLEDQLSPGLEFDFVAIRDIEPGDEVFLDYGVEWDNSWSAHLKNWKPVENANNYEDASQLNCLDKVSCQGMPALRTYEEQLEKPYSDQLAIYCYFNYWDGREMIWNDELDDWREPSGENQLKYPCNILMRNAGRLYNVDLTVPLYDDDGFHVSDIIVEVKDVPQWGIQFINRQYSSDLFLRNAFRHEMMIPDSIFPESWMNLS
ncbi:hypothetical protein HJC23_013149 [Cyclotella cryptica]|uniref:SET domain-containing protein n=1 Tax=Cyclotella cryptica TaxID=29204 RepID=A0ABD3QNR8_9STRA|eukprot:CCRYP_003968-RA/>CCRYP_003968-RA protein AED:0.11 eAED:0.11 QI:151/1/1/1/0.83/0.71/7/4658/616